MQEETDVRVYLDLPVTAFANDFDLKIVNTG